MGLIERSEDDAGLWTKAEYDRCPELAGRLHRRILDVQDERDAAQQQLRGAVAALEKIASLKPRPVLDPRDCEARPRRLAQEALDRLSGGR